MHDFSIKKSLYCLYCLYNKYNNTYHSTIRMKPVDVKWNTYIDSSKEINDKNSKFNIADNVRYQNIKMFWQKFTPQIGQKKFLWLKKLKILCRGHTLLVILTVKKLLERFMETNCK